MAGVENQHAIIWRHISRDLVESFDNLHLSGIFQNQRLESEMALQYFSGLADIGNRSIQRWNRLPIIVVANQNGQPPPYGRRLSGLGYIARLSLPIGFLRNLTFGQNSCRLNFGSH